MWKVQNKLRRLGRHPEPRTGEPELLEYRVPPPEDMGGGISGKHAGAILHQLPSQIVSYDDFKTAYPKGQVSSRETGFSHPYGNNPYRGYDRVGDKPFRFRDPVDKRLPAMERVLSVSVSGKRRIYPFSVVKTKPDQTSHQR